MSATSGSWPRPASPFFGHDVVCCDVDPDRIDALGAGKVRIYQWASSALLQRNRARLTFYLELADVLERLWIVFVRVDTPPTASGDADLSRVEAVGGHPG